MGEDIDGNKDLGKEEKVVMTEVESSLAGSEETLHIA
jgi:hypothetical protein